MAGRKIIHVDMDAFYASVEQRDDPDLRGRPVVVGGSPDGRGVVAAASYEARRFGVRSAMPSSQARRLCPQVVFVRPRFEAYSAVSRQLRAIFHEYTDLVGPLALDEAYLDVTTNHKGIALATDLAKELKVRIKSETELTASAGVAPTKFVAKVASDLRKPDGLVVVKPHQVRAFLADLPVERLWGVGPATAPRIRRFGVTTIGALALVPVQDLERSLGKFGRFLHLLAIGEDPREVTPHRPPKSRGAERTFEQDLSDIETMKEIVRGLADEAAESLRHMERPGRTVTLKVRYPDFQTVTRSRTLPRYTCDAEEIAAEACALLGATEAEIRSVRLLGVSLSNLLDPDDPLQLELPFPPYGAAGK